MKMRTDNRQPSEMRSVEIVLDYLMTAEGSALIKVGNTHVLCAATIEDSVPPFLRNSGKGWVTAEYSMLPRATAKRTPREVTKGRPSGKNSRNSAPDRALRAVRGGYGCVRRAHGDDRLRRAPGRWRHAHGIDHRRVCGAHRGTPATGAIRCAQVDAAARFRGRYERGAGEWRAHAGFELRRRLAGRRGYERGDDRLGPLRRSTGYRRTCSI